MKKRSRMGRCYARGVLVHKSIKINKNNALYLRVVFLRIDRFADKSSRLHSALATIIVQLIKGMEYRYHAGNIVSCSASVGEY